MELHGKGLGGVGAPHRVARQRWRRRLGRRGGVGERGQGDVTCRLTTGRAILPVEFGGEAVQGAGPHVLRGSGGVWGAGGWRAAQGGGTYENTEQTRSVSITNNPRGREPLLV